MIFIIAGIIITINVKLYPSNSESARLRWESAGIPEEDSSKSPRNPPKSSMKPLNAKESVGISNESVGILNKSAGIHQNLLRNHRSLKKIVPGVLLCKLCNRSTEMKSFPPQCVIPYCTFLNSLFNKIMDSKIHKKK